MPPARWVNPTPQHQSHAVRTAFDSLAGSVAGGFADTVTTVTEIIEENNYWEFDGDTLQPSVDVFDFTVRSDGGQMVLATSGAALDVDAVDPPNGNILVAAEQFLILSADADAYLCGLDTNVGADGLGGRTGLLNLESQGSSQWVSDEGVFVYYDASSDSTLQMTGTGFISHAVGNSVIGDDQDLFGDFGLNLKFDVDDGVDKPMLLGTSIDTSDIYLGHDGSGTTYVMRETGTVEIDAANWFANIDTETNLQFGSGLFGHLQFDAGESSVTLGDFSGTYISFGFEDDGDDGQFASMGAVNPAGGTVSLGVSQFGTFLAVYATPGQTDLYGSPLTLAAADEDGNFSFGVLADGTGIILQADDLSLWKLSVASDGTLSTSSYIIP